MKIARKPGATSQILQVFIQDSSSTTGAGLTGLVYNSSGLTAYYHRDTDTTATAISLVTMTVGTYTSGGFKEIDATNMPGWYQFCPPNAVFASGASSAGIHLKGATNMAPLPIEVDLGTQVDVEVWNGTAVATPANAGYPIVDLHTDLYFADIVLQRQISGGTDEYTVTWYKNGVRITAGITSPTIEVVKRSDGTDLIATTTMTQIGTTGSYKYDATGAALETAGNSYLVIASATIDSATRSYARLLGRDAS